VGKVKEENIKEEITNNIFSLLLNLFLYQKK